MTIRECATCRRWFLDSDGTGVCPQGHEPVAVDDADFVVGERPDLPRSGVAVVLDAADRVTAAVQACNEIRALHVGIYTRTLDEEGNPEEYCEACSTEHPCATIRILDERSC